MSNRLRKSILVVDDNPGVLNVLTSALDRFGYHVQACASSSDALDVLINGNMTYDIILTDIRMPGNTGIELMEKTVLLFPDTPVILMTGFVDIEATISAIKQHAFDFITKPINITQLESSIKKAFDYLELKRIEKDYWQMLEITVAEKTLALNEKIASLKKSEARERHGRQIREELIEQLRLQIKLMPIGYILFDADFHFISLNPAAERIFGFSMKELLGKKPFGLIIPEASRTSAEMLATGLRSGDLSCYDICNNLTKDGRTITCDWIYTPIRNSAGDLVSIMSMIQDITIPKQVDLALRESESRYRSLVDNLPLGISLIDRDHRIVMVNKTHAKWYGHSPEWFVGHNCFKIFEKTENICAHCPGLVSMASGMPSTVDSEGVRDDGTRFPVRIRSVPVIGTNGETSGFIEIVEDITERIQAEESLRQSEERFRQLFEQNGDAIALIDLNTMSVININKQMMKLFGFNREELVRDGISLLFPTTTCPDLLPMIREIPSKGELRIDKIGVVRKDDFSFFVSIRGYLITLLQGVFGFLSFRDISENIRMQEEAQATQSKLIHIDKMASLGILSSGIAHEINNPNNFILSNAESLAEIWQSAMPIIEGFYKEYGDFKLGKYKFSRLRVIAPQMFAGLVTGSQRIRDIVELLKNFVRQDSGNINDPVDVNKTIINAITILNHEIKKRCDNFELNTGYDLPPVRGNAQQIEQVIVNLLLNSIQALSDKTRAIRITSGVSEDSEHVFISIKDEGGGISPEVMAHITEPFFTTKGKSGGTGLGLSISASILKDNHGLFSFSSEPGMGTTVTILLQVFTNQK